MPQQIPVGFASIFGALITILAGVGAVVAAIEGNDTAALTGGIGSTLTGLTLLGGRFAQAVTIARTVATTVDPYVDAVFDALTDPEADAVDDDELPSDEDEFASPPPEEG